MSPRARGAAKRSAARIAVLGMLFAFAGSAEAREASSLVIGSGNRAHVDARPGEIVTLTGSVTSSFDGAVFDAATTTMDGQVREAGLLSLDGSGFRLLSRDADAHVVRLVATGEDAPACRAAGLGDGPCFLDGTSVLAHERLLTVEELGRTLRGSSFALDVDLPTHTPPPVSTTIARRLGWLGVAIAFACLALFSWRRARAMRGTLLGQVHDLAREAKKRTEGDATLAAVGAEIEELVRRAEDLERVRRATATRLSRIDRKLLEARRATWSAAQGPASQGAANWLAAELAEADRVAADHGAAVAGLEQIVSALRVISLASREGRNLATVDPAGVTLARVARELTLRDDALLETERDGAHGLESIR